MIFKEESAQVSIELILLLVGIIMIVLTVMDMYNHYMVDWGDEINNSEASRLIEEIDNLKNI